MNLSEFLNMGGYAIYVWPCYGLTLLILLMNGVLGRRRHAAEIAAARRRSQSREVTSRLPDNVA
jgi:heme exporter protein D